MTATSIQIKDVSDTSLWVAYYRAEETERPNALFRDPFAKVLVGERGQKIAESMKSIGRYTRWSVVTRTVVIDDFIQSLILEGIDTVINLGAGLDTRPYRMKLPKTLRWIEVDYPHIVAHKNKILKSEIPSCQLTRVELDLGNDTARAQFLKQAGSQSKKALIITEGVIPYLTEEQVSKLALELRTQPGFAFWIAEFFDPKVYRYLKRPMRTAKMINAPFQFYPNDYFGFFARFGWTPKEIRYLGEEALKQGRSIPMPWWANILKLFFNKKALENSQRMTGYIIFKK